MEKKQEKVDMTPEQKIIRQIDLDEMNMEVKKLEQTNRLIQEDIDSDVQNNKLRIMIRKNNVRINLINFDIKNLKKAMRENTKVQLNWDFRQREN